MRGTIAETLESFDGSTLALDDTALTPHDAERLRARPSRTATARAGRTRWSNAQHEDALRRAAAEEALQAVCVQLSRSLRGIGGQFHGLASEMITTLPDSRTRSATASVGGRTAGFGCAPIRGPA